MPVQRKIGTGSPEWIWRVHLGLGFRFDWGGVTVALRVLGFEPDKSDVDVTFNEPELGMGSRW